jgi:hypothetical protein
MLRIQLLKQEIVASSGEDEIEILKQAKKRVALCEEIKGPKTKELLSYQVNSGALPTEVKKDVEMTQISKIMHPTYKGPVGGSTLLSHTASTTSKANKKHNPPPPTLDDFNKNLLKKQTSKKNSSPHRNGR